MLMNAHAHVYVAINALFGKPNVGPMCSARLLCPIRLKVGNHPLSFWLIQRVILKVQLIYIDLTFDQCKRLCDLGPTTLQCPKSWSFIRPTYGQ